MNCPGYIKALLVVVFTALAIISCKPKVISRPIGYHNLGPLDKLLAPETEITEHKLLIRRDARGLSAMSTMCTHDLTYLKRAQLDGKEFYTSTYTDSKYTLDGTVISGPSVAPLPYFELKIDSSIYGGPRDTLYAYVGKEVPKDWRLEIK